MKKTLIVLSALVLQSCDPQEATNPPAPVTQQTPSVEPTFFSPAAKAEAESRARALLKLGGSESDARALIEEASFQEALDLMHENDRKKETTNQQPTK